MRAANGRLKRLDALLRGSAESKSHRPLLQRDGAFTKIDAESLTAKEVQTQQTVDASPQRQAVPEYCQIRAIAAQRAEALYCQPRQEFNARRSGDPNTVCHQRRIVSSSDKRRDADQRG
jgi:hypothetical protein